MNKQNKQELTVSYFLLIFASLENVLIDKI